MKKIISDRNTFSWIALVLLVLGEAFAFGGIQDSWCVWGPWTLVSIILILALWVWSILGDFNFNIRSVILTKLLANAIAPQRLGTIYLLLFVIHVGWLTNAIMSLFMPTDNLIDVLIAIGVCVVGMLVLICFFPNGSINMDNFPQRVFVSGISPLPTAKIDPKTGKMEDPVLYSKFNLIPLVKMLELIEKELNAMPKEEKNNQQLIPRCKFLIIKTNYYDNIKPTTPYLDQTAGLEICDDDDKTRAELGDYNIEPTNPIDDRLRLIIKKTAIKEFSNSEGMPDWIKNYLQIKFTTSVDYDDYEKCFIVTNEEIKKLDAKKNLFYFNLTPGTATIKLILTLLSISAKHRLFYYSQGKDQKLVEVKKSLLPLKNLLSQALETFESGNQK